MRSAKLSRSESHLLIETIGTTRQAALFEDGVTANFDALIALGDFAAASPLADFIDASRLAEASRQ